MCIATACDALLQKVVESQSFRSPHIAEGRLGTQLLRVTCLALKRAIKHKKLWKTTPCGQGRAQTF